MTLRQLTDIENKVNKEAPKGNLLVDTDIDFANGIVSLWYSWKGNDDLELPERRLEICFGNGMCILRMWFLYTSDYCIEIGCRPIHDAESCIHTFWHIITADQVVNL